MMFTLKTKQGYVDTFATAAAMSSAHGAYVASGIHVKPSIGDAAAYAIMNENGDYTYDVYPVQSDSNWFDRYFA